MYEDEDDDSLGTARGIVNGIMIALVFWLLLIGGCLLMFTWAR